MRASWQLQQSTANPGATTANVNREGKPVNMDTKFATAVMTSDDSTEVYQFPDAQPGGGFCMGGEGNCRNPRAPGKMLCSECIAVNARKKKTTNRSGKGFG
eukprot:g21189.t1